MMEKAALAEKHYARGEELLEEADYEGALESYRQAFRMDPSLARYSAAYGLCAALVEKRFKYGRELCTEAVRQVPSDAKLHHYLARVYLTFGHRREGVRSLQQGLKANPRYLPIHKEMKLIGVRRLPVFSFLPRNSFLNVIAGKLRARHEAERSERKHR